MPNHPNRNWRSRMHEACAAYVRRWQWPAGGIAMLNPSDLMQIVSDAYLAGYEAGRASTTRAKAPA